MFWENHVLNKDCKVAVKFCNRRCGMNSSHDPWYFLVHPVGPSRHMFSASLSVLVRKGPTSVR